MNIDGLTSENCLFLICPTDYMEPVLAKSFMGQAFFYTALGVCFQWDDTTQESLINFIRKEKIKQIVLLTKMNNKFFMDKLKVKFNLAYYPVEKTLQLIEDDIPTRLEYWDTQFSKGTLLAVKYLRHQKNRLLKSSHLGQLIKNEEINVLNLLFEEQKNVFYKAKKLKDRVALFKYIYMN